MAKIPLEQLQRIKRVQDAEDDDLEVDVTKKHRAQGSEKARHEETDEEKRKDTRNLLILLGSVLGIVLVLVVILAFYRSEKTTMTIDELHAANVEGKLKPTQGYIYNGYSFVKFGDLWYSQLKKGNTLYDISFNFDPKSVENVTVKGMLNTGFVKEKHLYVTFDPEGDDLQYIAIANYGLSRSLAWAFGYNMTAACTKNITKACEKAGVVQCGDADKAVVYFKEDNETALLLNSTCLTVQGRGSEIVRAKDRLLLRWYGIVD